MAHGRKREEITTESARLMKKTRWREFQKFLPAGAQAIFEAISCRRKAKPLICRQKGFFPHLPSCWQSTDFSISFSEGRRRMMSNTSSSHITPRDEDHRMQQRAVQLVPTVIPKIDASRKRMNDAHAEPQ
jgi:hypothetical protein